MSKKLICQHEAGQKTKIEHIKQFYAEKGRLLKADMQYVLEMAERGVAASMPKSELVIESVKCPERDVLIEFDSEQVVTLSVSLGVMMLMVLEKQLPDHSVLARTGRLSTYNAALLNLVMGHGKALDEDTITYWQKVWNLTWNTCMERIKHEYELEDANGTNQG